MTKKYPMKIEQTKLFDLTINRLKKEIEILEMANDILETANCKMRDTLNLYGIDEEIWEVK